MSTKDPASMKPEYEPLPAIGDAAETEVTLSFADNKQASIVFGQYDHNLAKIERKLNVIAAANGNHVTLRGAPASVDHAKRALDHLYARAVAGHSITLGEVDGALEESALQASLFPADARDRLQPFEEIRTRKKPGVRARNAAQSAYLRALKKFELVFAEGPAGTGKTWLAVGHAVSLLEQGLVERIILSRPAVEAGERLGFLPGDMREKVDPYLRPIYDALQDFLDSRMIERGMQTGMIEVAPLAFMRGRTLSNACVLLDEAQNTTTMQMKMFLTRLGEGSRMIINGDPTQTDLPPGQRSGLAHALQVLSRVEGIGHIVFREGDVVRHDLVRRIVDAYGIAERAGTKAVERQ